MVSLMRRRARELRNNPTPAERAFWNLVRGDRLGLKFRRQYRLGNYIVDFACFEARLIVEIDGGQHNESAYDARRDAWLARGGFRVLRFWNGDVLVNPDGVVETVLTAAHDSLSPSRGRGPRIGGVAGDPCAGG